MKTLNFEEMEMVNGGADCGLGHAALAAATGLIGCAVFLWYCSN
jgi:hypothetical protein